MIAVSRVSPSARTASRPGLSGRLSQGMAAFHRMLEDTILPMRGGHPALGDREPPRF